MIAKAWIQTYLRVSTKAQTILKILIGSLCSEILQKILLDVPSILKLHFIPSEMLVIALSLLCLHCLLVEQVKCFIASYRADSNNPICKLKVFCLHMVGRREDCQILPCLLKSCIIWNSSELYASVPGRERNLDTPFPSLWAEEVFGPHPCFAVKYIIYCTSKQHCGIQNSKLLQYLGETKSVSGLSLAAALAPFIVLFQNTEDWLTFSASPDTEKNRKSWKRRKVKEKNLNGKTKDTKKEECWILGFSDQFTFHHTKTLTVAL